MEVLRSQDCFQQRFRHEALALAASSARSQQTHRPNPNPNSDPMSCAGQGRRRKRSPGAVQAYQNDRDRSRHCNRSMVEKSPATNLVMGQVKILKRCENLSRENYRARLDASLRSPKVRAKSEECFDLLLGTTDRLGPNPKMVQKQVRVWDSTDGMYAGFVCVASPPPSSVPVPGFLRKNGAGAATSCLRQLLRIE